MGDLPEHPHWLTDWVNAAPPGRVRSATFDPALQRWQRWEQGACYGLDPERHLLGPLEPVLSEEGIADAAGR